MTYYTVTEMLTRARTIFQARSTDARLTQKQRNDCGTAVTRITTIMGHVDPATQTILDPAQRAQDVSMLRTGVNQLNDAMLAHPEIAGADFFDAIDLGQAAADCLEQLLPGSELGLSTGAP